MRIQPRRLELTCQDLQVAGPRRVSRLQALAEELDMRAV